MDLLPRKWQTRRNNQPSPTMNGIRTHLLLWFAVLSASAHATDPGQSQSIPFQDGSVRGVVSDGVASFKGLRYAAPPVGQLRWRPPQPTAAVTGVQSAGQFGNDCMQTRLPWERSSSAMSEDCLFINVWTPAQRGSVRLPVMVWIHGGGFVTGSGSASNTDGAQLAKRAVVSVSLNYRLGRFGFFAHPALTAQAQDEAVGNYGLMDQIAALRWVQANIAAFGGDPANVTIFGESAGGASVNYLMIAPEARGLFHKGIVESGGGRDEWVPLQSTDPGKRTGESVGVAFAKSAGLNDASAAALRSLPAAAVVRKLGMLDMQETLYSGAMIDGRLIPSQASVAFAAGKQARVPYLVGSNSDELGQLPMIKTMTATLLQRMTLDEQQRRQLFDLFGAEAGVNAHLINDMFFNEPARHFAAAVQASGQPAWLYRFSYVPEVNRPKQLGAPHASEVAFVFDNLGALLKKVSNGDRTTAALLADYWTNFAKTGNPNGDGLPRWPQHQPQQALLDFTNAGPVVREGMDRQRLDFLASLHARP